MNPPKKRGLCGSCYQQANRAIELGSYTDEEFVDLGVMLPSGARGLGRKPKSKSLILDLIAQRRSSEPAVIEHPQQNKIDKFVKNGSPETPVQGSGQAKKGGSRKSKSGK